MSEILSGCAVRAEIQRERDRQAETWAEPTFDPLVEKTLIELRAEGAGLTIDGLERLAQIAESEYGWKATHDRAEVREQWEGLQRAITWIRSLRADPLTSDLLNRLRVEGSTGLDLSPDGMRELLKIAGITDAAGNFDALQKLEGWMREQKDLIARVTSLQVNAQAGQPFDATATFEGAGVKLFAAHMAQWFDTQGGKNFVTVTLTDPNDRARVFELTMQRAGGKTPSELLLEMRTLLKEIYDADEEAIKELRKVDSQLADLYDGAFARRIEALLGLPAKVSP